MKRTSGRGGDRALVWSGVAGLAGLCGAGVSAPAAVVWNESANCALSSNQASPTAISLAAGTNSIIGNVGSGKTQDWVALTVPSGFVLSGIVLTSYQSTDSQGFTGVQAGPSFVGSPFSASSYLGYVHYGTGATNGALPPTNLVGTDLLPLMGNTSLAAGSQGFTPPLPSGVYTFLIQQLGAATAYQFDYQVTAAPGPTAAAGLLLGAAVLGAGRRRRGLK